MPATLKRDERMVDVYGENGYHLRYKTRMYFTQSEVETAAREHVQANRPDVPQETLRFAFYPKFEENA